MKESMQGEIKINIEMNILARAVPPHQPDGCRDQMGVGSEGSGTQMGVAGPNGSGSQMGMGPDRSGVQMGIWGGSDGNETRWGRDGIRQEPGGQTWGFSGQGQTGVVARLSDARSGARHR